ncbi:MAG: MerR family transcriptional regulator [Proteobacteria bacterium]|nr:MerR family transcriptional regulator [Pseudomonadota bacterium]
MTQWYVKDLSKLIGVSVQTLHHYDRINLLKPSVRLPNGYRVYSEKDLLQLQQIIALKFFGFDLTQIKAFLTGGKGTLEHFSVQAKLLEQKAKTLLDASNTLKSIISDVVDDKSIPWVTIIKLIEVYRMIQQLEHSWVKEIFTPEELKQYATFETELKTNSTKEQKEAFEKNWANLVDEMKRNLEKEPTSPIGIALGKKCMDWLNQVYGKKYAHLRTKKFEKGFAQGKGLDEVGLTPEIVSWMDKAIDAYWRDRIYSILNQVGSGVSDETIFKLWKETLDDMYGIDNSRKKEIYDLALADEKVSFKAKEWLQSLRDLVAANSHLL